MIFYRLFVIPLNTYRIEEFIKIHNSMVRPIALGHERINSTDYRWNNSRMKAGQDFFFVQYTLTGHGWYEAQNKKWKLQPGMAFLGIQQIPFSYYFAGDTATWEFTWMAMLGTSGLSVFKEIYHEFGPVIRLDLKSQSVQMLLDFIRQADLKKFKNLTSTSVHCYQFILQLVADLRSSGGLKQNNRILEVFSYMESHLHQPLDIKVLSPVFGYSREHFTRIFRKTTGLSPGRYLCNLRLERAKQLLRSTDDSLDQIASNSGLNNSNYLCRIFRKKFGITPSQYKNSFDARIG